MTTVIDVAASPSPRLSSSSRSSSSHSHLSAAANPNPNPTSFPSLHAHLDAYESADSDDSDEDWATRYGMVRGGGNEDKQHALMGTETHMDKEDIHHLQNHHHQHQHPYEREQTTSDEEREHKHSSPRHQHQHQHHTTMMDTDTDADVMAQPVTAPLLHKPSALTYPDHTMTAVGRQPSIGVIPVTVPTQSIYQRSNTLLSCILMFLVMFQLAIGIFGLLLTISAWNATCDYPLQFLSLSISILFISFGCVLAAYMCLVSAEQATKAFATLFCLLYFAGVPLFWVGLYMLHRSSQCDASLTEQLYQLYSPLFMVPWLVMLSSIVVIPVMLYYGCKALASSKHKTDKIDPV